MCLKRAQTCRNMYGLCLVRAWLKLKSKEVLRHWHGRWRVGGVVYDVCGGADSGASLAQAVAWAAAVSAAWSVVFRWRGRGVDHGAGDGAVGGRSVVQAQALPRVWSSLFRRCGLRCGLERCLERMQRCFADVGFDVCRGVGVGVSVARAGVRAKGFLRWLLVFGRRHGGNGFR